MTSNIQIKRANYTDTQEAADLKALLNDYAKDPMGGGHAMDPETLDSLPSKLADLPSAFSILAYVDGKPAGLTNCFFGFSTFAAKPLVNIHDVTVRPEFRGLGLSKKMLAKVEAIAQENGCCKLTLEVLSNNTVAMKAYQSLGFAGYELDPEAGHAVFCQKKL